MAGTPGEILRFPPWLSRNMAVSVRTQVSRPSNQHAAVRYVSRGHSIRGTRTKSMYANSYCYDVVADAATWVPSSRSLPSSVCIRKN